MSRLSWQVPCTQAPAARWSGRWTALAFSVSGWRHCGLLPLLHLECKCGWHDTFIALKPRVALNLTLLPSLLLCLCCWLVACAVHVLSVPAESVEQLAADGSGFQFSMRDPVRACRIARLGPHTVYPPYVAVGGANGLGCVPDLPPVGWGLGVV